MARHISGYAYEARPMAPDEGEGWIVTFPDLSGCLATGETMGQALLEARDALKSFVLTSREAGLPLPLCTHGGVRPFQG